MRIHYHDKLFLIYHDTQYHDINNKNHNILDVYNDLNSPAIGQLNHLPQDHPRTDSNLHACLIWPQLPEGSSKSGTVSK